MGLSYENISAAGPNAATAASLTRRPLISMTLEASIVMAHAATCDTTHIMLARRPHFRTERGILSHTHGSCSLL